MKKIISVLILIFAFSFTVSAENNSDVYEEQYRLSGAEDIEGALPEETREFMRESGIDPKDSNWVSTLTEKSVFEHIKNFVLGGIKTPFKAGAAILGVVLVTAAVTAIGNIEENVIPSNYVAALAVIAVAANPLWESVSAAVNAVKGCGTFMLSFVPIFTSVVALSGGGATSVSMSALLLGAAETVVSVASFAVLPLMGGYLGMSLCASVSPLQNAELLPETIKKISLWIISLVSVLFTGILGIQTAVNSAADSVALKTARFIVGSSVPVAGSALSEAVSAVTSSIGLLRSSVGIYGVFALAVIILPVVAELVLWRIVFAVCATVSEMLSVQKISGILRSVDSMLSVLLGVSLFVAAMFIISLTVVIGAVKT